MRERFIRLEDPELAYLVQGEPSFQTYIEDMLWAQRYAMGSRAVMVERLLSSLFDVVGTGRQVCTINCHHDFTQRAPGPAATAAGPERLHSRRQSAKPWVAL